MTQILADAVVEGGGIKVFGLVGALSVAEEKGYHWKRLAGTSAGSIVASLLAAGYRSRELYDMLEDFDFTQFTPTRWYHQIPYTGSGIRFLIKKGFYSGKPLEYWMEEWLGQKGVYTFADLKEKELSIIASDISRGNLLVLPKDLDEYGISKNRFPIARAVRMSCSIPFFFDPVRMRHKPSQKSSYVVDGGVLSNFPVWLFDQKYPRWPTFGFRFVSDTKESRQIEGPFSMLWAMFLTMMDAHDNRHIKEQDRVRTIQVPTLGVKITDFDLSREKRKELFQAGVEAAQSFFEDWTFKQYLSSRGGGGNVNIKVCTKGFG
ncbi:patatin-like phospholipase family protein [Melghirimyces algeriensis]|uniref:NTE family protein n=1 Tax=Melghirimyces algeriensis TaxID=910412 RepID=A0A521AXG9_9BACL|nr:patatin-like phospholipase family protein [Melghirimyces algeriensis]SMO39494.1 NTE family protein [Melghirimyces algeriensis]